MAQKSDHLAEDRVEHRVVVRETGHLPLKGPPALASAPRRCQLRARLPGDLFGHPYADDACDAG